MANETRPDGPKPIAVKLLKFRAPVDIPSKEGTEGITSGTVGGVKFEIEFQPWTRHHRITVTRHGEKPIVRMVHESSVMQWEPLL